MAVHTDHVFVVREIEPAQFQMQFYSKDVVCVLCQQCVGREKYTGYHADVQPLFVGPGAEK